MKTPKHSHSPSSPSSRSTHSPNLNTILMVENALLEKAKAPLTVANLKRSLPKQVNHNTLILILEYLEKSKKISVSLKGISWVWEAAK